MIRLLARATAPFAFRSRARTAAQLQRFALAEHESMLELKAAAARTPSADRRALYLRHAIDEARHARTFAAHASDIRRALGDGGFPAPHTDCEALFERLGEEGFLAFVHRGERRGRMQFEAYESFFAARGDDKLRAMFAALITDELEHEAYTLRLLTETTGTVPAAQRALRRIAAWEAWRSWRRNGSALASLMYAVCMFVVYLALAPFALLLRMLRPAPRGWRP